MSQPARTSVTGDVGKKRKRPNDNEEVVDNSKKEEDASCSTTTTKLPSTTKTTTAKSILKELLHQRQPRTLRCYQCKNPNVDMNMGICGTSYHIDCFFKLLKKFKYKGFFGLEPHCVDCLQKFNRFLKVDFNFVRYIDDEVDDE